MASENGLWGAERIRGEMLKLGVKVSKRTVQKYMPKERHNKSGQAWATFLKNPIRDIWACDFTVVYDLLFRPLYVFVIMELHTRRIVQEYLDYCNRSRPHPGIGQQLPECFTEGSLWSTGQPGGRIASTPVLSGLHQSYARAAVGLH
jgi:hypothetical protein